MDDNYLSQFKAVGNVREGVDCFQHPVTNSMAYVVKFDGKNFWIFISLDSNLSEEEFNVNEVLVHLISYYLHKKELEFIRLFKNCDIDPGRIRVKILSDNYIKENEKLDDSLITDLKPEEPIYIETKHFKPLNIYEMCAVYLIEDVANIFSLENNNAERYIIKLFIQSIYSESGDDLSKAEIEKIVDVFINQNIPQGKPAFNLEILAPLNEGILDYSDPIETSEIEKLNVEELISQYLMDNDKINSGSFSNDDAKNIINKIFAFVQSQLELEIENYNVKALLHFTYSQLEFLKNYRESMEITFGMATKSYTEYDVVEEKKKVLEEVIIRNNALHHLLETILKVLPSEDKNMYINDFQYLEALATSALNLSSISDFIHYNIIPHKITINDDYSFDLEEIEVKIDGDKYLTDISKWGLKDDYNKYKQVKQLSKVERGEKDTLPPEYGNIEAGFEYNFGFKYSSFLKVIGAMSRINSLESDCYPLVYFDKESLLNRIKKIIGVDLSDDIIFKIIDFICIDYTRFKKEDPFVPQLLRMDENRFSLKPVIKFSKQGETNFLYGSCSVYSTGGIYSHKISTGRFPYVVNKRTSLSRKLKLMEELHNNELENKVKNIAVKLFGEDNIESNLKNFHRIDYNLPKYPDCGEIDCIAIDNDKKIIHVLEAKDVIKAVVPREIFRELNKFFDLDLYGKNYAGKLIKKAEFVSENLETFLNHFNVVETEGWEVKKAFATYEVHMSSYSKGNEIKFIPISELENYLR